MIIYYYTWAALVLFVFVIGWCFGKEEAVALGRIVLRFFLLLPIFGRVLGYW